MKTFVTDLDNTLSEIPSGSIVFYQYPAHSNGFSFLSHLSTIYGDTDTEVVVFTENKNTVQHEFKIYTENTQIATYETQYPAENIRVVEDYDNSLENLLESDISDSIVIYDSFTAVDSEFTTLDDLRESLDKNNITVIISENSNETTPDTQTVAELADVVVSFNTELQDMDSVEYLFIHKHRYNKSLSFERLDIEFTPYLTIKTEQKN
jgi:hypothetical protein